MRWTWFPGLMSMALLATGCASGPEPPPYPAFVVSDELPDMFMASLPGVRAKQYSGDDQARSMSGRVELPADWTGTTGGSPGKALEIFVLAGELRLADMSLGAGSYAYLPPGSLGFNMTTDDGARILFFRDNLNNAAVIRTPLILDSALIDWTATDTAGVSTKDLRADPGSGARTWLLRVEPGATQSWQSSSVSREGYLVDGQYQHSECVNGEAFTELYAPGGYFNRPANAVNGGPLAQAITDTVWFLRETRKSATSTDHSCIVKE